MTDGNGHIPEPTHLRPISQAELDERDRIDSLGYVASRVPGPPAMAVELRANQLISELRSQLSYAQFMLTRSRARADALQRSNWMLMALVACLVATLIVALR